ncbi:unnamed protein product [Boreogadus saida]
MALSVVRSFTLELDRPSDAVYTSGEVVSGQVVLVLNKASKVRSMKVVGRGVAMAHWLENWTVGMNAVYNDYTSKITYFRKRQHLIRGHLAEMCCVETFERQRAKISQHQLLSMWACVLTLNRRPLPL